MKKRQDKGRKLELHKETLQILLMATGGDPSVTCVTCPDHQTVTADCGACT